MGETGRWSEGRIGRAWSVQRGIPSSQWSTDTGTVCVGAGRKSCAHKALCNFYTDLQWDRGAATGTGFRRETVGQIGRWDDVRVLGGDDEAMVVGGDRRMGRWDDRAKRRQDEWRMDDGKVDDGKNGRWDDGTMATCDDGG